MRHNPFLNEIRKAFMDSSNDLRAELLAKHNHDRINVLLLDRQGAVVTSAISTVGVLSAKAKTCDAITFNGTTYRADETATIALGNTVVYREVTTITFEEYVAGGEPATEDAAEALADGPNLA